MDCFLFCKPLKKDCLFVLFTVGGFGAETVTFGVVLEDFPVDFTHGGGFELDARLVFALFPKKSGEAEADEDDDDYFSPVRVQHFFQPHKTVFYYFF
jgi:hypothetical protein